MAAIIQPRKHRYRTTLIALLILSFITAYIFMFQQRAFSPALALKRGDVPPMDQMTIALESLRHHTGSKRPLSYTKPDLKLKTDEELAAVSSFLASLPQNVIPSFVDPTRPIDPQLVVDFDTRSPRAADEIRQMVEDVWTRNPVFLYSKLYSPVSREVKSMLANLHLQPSPTIIDVDIRDDAEVLEPLVRRLTSAEELPVLLISGQRVGDITTIRSLHQSGQLKEMIKDAGAVIDGGKKKHK